MVHGQIIKKRKADELGLTYYLTGKPCVNGHYSYRYTKHGNCLACIDENYSIRKKSEVKHMLQTKKAECKFRGIEFNLEEQDVEVPSKCPVLGIPLNRECRDSSPSIDRVDPSKGYTKDNVAVISMRANRIKSNASALELRMIAQYMDEEINK